MVISSATLIETMAVEFLTDPETSASSSNDFGGTDSSLPDELPVGALPVPPVDRKHTGLHRGLSIRQVSMIAVAGTIGTGLFLGTGKSLAEGGPASMLICYG